MQIKCFETIDNSAFNFYLQLPPANKVLFFYFSKNKEWKGVGSGILFLEWLKTAPIPKLTAEEKKDLGIEGFNID